MKDKYYAAYRTERFDDGVSMNVPTPSLQTVLLNGGVDYDLVLLFRKAGINLVTTYHIDPKLPNGTLLENIYALKTDKTYAAVASATVYERNKYGLGTNMNFEGVPANEIADRIYALRNAILTDQGVAVTDNSSVALSPKNIDANSGGKGGASTNQLVPITNTAKLQAAQNLINNQAATGGTDKDIDPNIYQYVRNMLQDKIGRRDLGDDPEKLQAINQFLRQYPYRPVAKDGNSFTTDTLEKSNPPFWIDLPVRVLFTESIQTAIDIINDVSKVVSEEPFISSVEFRREIFEAFTKKERRTYVGLWLIFLSFILYFIDSAA